MENVSYYTEEGLQKLKDALKELKTKERAKVAKQLAEAREKGDLSENAEYEAAKDAQGLLELKISKLEETVFKARVICEDDVDISKVSILTKVKIKSQNNGREFTYAIVSEEEADLKSGKISVKSPIGQGLLGKKIGEVATVNAPAGKMKFEILSIGL
ncbi:MAG: transcription elongation factor GreA [Cytophagales bacterium]|nr:transcription elongation factor GreA [Cytophagales bacterium]